MLFSLQGSVECRLLTSVFYEFGKNLATQCPYSGPHQAKESNDFFTVAFHEFVKLFPNLHLDNDEFASQKIQIGTTISESGTSKSVTFIAFTRLHARNGFVASRKTKIRVYGLEAGKLRKNISWVGKS